MIIYKNRLIQILCLVLVFSTASQAIEKNKILKILKAAKQHKRVQILTTQSTLESKKFTTQKTTVSAKIEYGSLPNIPSTSSILKSQFAKKTSKKPQVLNRVKQTSNINPIAKQIKYY